MVPEDIARRIRTSFDDAVGTPWQDVALDDPYIAGIIARAGFPLDVLDGAAPAVEQALQSSEETELPLWSVELLDDGDQPALPVRSRGFGDDSVRGTNMRLLLIETRDGWEVESATSRSLCTRSNPTAESPSCV